MFCSGIHTYSPVWAVLPVHLHTAEVGRDVDNSPMLEEGKKEKLCFENGIQLQLENQLA